MLEISKICENTSGISGAVIFGSRANGNFKRYSDIDIAIYGSISDLEIEALASMLEELPTVYTFDLISYSRITNEYLKNHIDQVGIKIYERLP